MGTVDTAHEVEEDLSLREHEHTGRTLSALSPVSTGNQAQSTSEMLRIPCLPPACIASAPHRRISVCLRVKRYLKQYT